MLMRFDPFRDVDRLMDQLSGQSARATRSFPMDAFRRGDRFIVLLDLPGLDPGAIDLTVDRNVLTIKAERQAAREQGDELLVAERPQGTFSRQLLLGDTLDPERLEATYEHGVLTITIPVAEQAKPRRIEVSSPASDRPETIEGSTSEGSG